MTKTQERRDAARKAARSAATDLRVVLNDARRQLDEFETYVDSWDDAVESMREGGLDPAAMAERYVVERALGMLDEIVHMPTGGTQHMHVRAARTRLLQLLAGEEAL